MSTHYLGVISSFIFDPPCSESVSSKTPIRPNQAISNTEREDDGWVVTGRGLADIVEREGGREHDGAE
jgi:hypothetical protein